MSSLLVIVGVTLLMIAYILSKPLEMIKTEDQNFLATLSSDLADKLRADPFYQAMKGYD